MNAQVITTESFGTHQFSSVEILRGDWEKMYRQYSLQRAERMGKKQGGKVRISFRTNSNEICKVKVAVASVSDAFVYLTDGKIIPIRSIFMVEF